MKVEDFERVIEELAELKVFFINISGGEPFAHPNINEILKIANNTFNYVLVLSNGTILSSKHKQNISEIINKNGSYNTQISLDAIDETMNKKTRGNTAKVLANIKWLSEMGANIIVASVVTRYNINQIETLIHTLEKHTRYFHLMTVQDVRGVQGIEDHLKISKTIEEKLWEKMFDLAEEDNLFINTPKTYGNNSGCAHGSPCMAAFSHLVIDPDLKIRPCDRLTDVIIGDLNSTTLKEIWNCDKVLPLLEGKTPYCRR
jgi:MoaA/NifB/PqqE/SkfB family radical SAM enzyme